jgi:hypothetical protein
MSGLCAAWRDIYREFGRDTALLFFSEDELRIIHSKLKARADRLADRIARAKFKVARPRLGGCAARPVCCGGEWRHCSSRAGSGRAILLRAYGRPGGRR